MQVDIKTSDIRPIRQTFSHIARRFGADKPATRYQEATFDLQPEVNFHYRPLWQPQYDLYDKRRTAIEMADWYAFRDPRHFYYGVYVQARAKQQELQENSFEFVERRGMLRDASQEDRERLTRLLVPLRHYEWGANMNNGYVTAFGYGSAITQATQYQTMDRLGLAQYLTRIGLLLEEGTAALDAAKRAWLEDPIWQGMRRELETLFVTQDWFEVLVAQDLVFDALVHPLAMQGLESTLSQQAANGYALSLEFAKAWYEESMRWIDATLRTAVGESQANSTRLSSWYHLWSTRLLAAMAPWAQAAFGEEGKVMLAGAAAALAERAKRIGIDVDAAAPAEAARGEQPA